MLVSIIIPVYNERDNLEALYSRLLEKLPSDDPDVSYEFVFLDDCSADDSFGKLVELARSDCRIPVQIIRLSRNAGTHVGLQVAAGYCRGEAAIYLAADLQCPVEAIPELVARYRESYDIVWGLRAERKDPLSTRIFAALYYFIMRLLVHHEMRFHNVETFLISRKVIEPLLRTREKNTNLIMLIAGLGFRQGSIIVKRQERKAGRSGWSFWKKAKLFTDSLVSFSYLPIRMISLLGILVSLAGFFYAGYLIYGKLIGITRPEGWTFIVVLILLLSGFQMLMLGLLGEYLWRILDQVSSRPMYVVDRVVKIDTRNETRATDIKD